MKHDTRLHAFKAINPTPSQIKNVIYDAIYADMENHPVDGPDMPLPSRAFKLVRDAISQTCDAQ